MPSGDLREMDFGMPMRGAANEQKLFGRYTLKRVLGRGGMGIVWLAHDDELNRYVAMKFLPDMIVRDREAVEDLKRETRRSLDLTHHHIVRIYDFTQDDMVAAIIMEYVDGETLSAMKTQQEGGCFSVNVVAPWIAHFASALDYAHRQARVIHRDLKPANLMVNSRGDLKITDFGISRSMSDSMTRVSVSNTAGTLAYMSPEQALGAPPMPGDDIYAFGATVYDLMTGRPPFFRGNLQVQLETVIPPRMGDRREELGNSGETIPDLWEEVIALCLAKRPQDRPESIAAVAHMLGLSGGGSQYRPGTGSGTTLPGTVSGTTLTRMRGPEEATDVDPVTPRTSQPATNRPTSKPRPTAKPTDLGEILGGEPIRVHHPVAPAHAPSTDGTGAGATLPPPEEPTMDGVASDESPDHAEVTAEGGGTRDSITQEALPLPTPLAAPAPPSTFSVPPAQALPKRPSKGLAIAAGGSVALLVAGGIWYAAQKPEGSHSVVPVPTVAPAPPPKPTYKKEIEEIRSLIANDRLPEANDLLTKIPGDLSEVTELKAAIVLRQGEIAKREAMLKEEGVAKLLKDASSAMDAGSYDTARDCIRKVMTLDPSYPDAKVKLTDIDDAEARSKMEAARLAVEKREEADRQAAAVAEAKANAEKKALEEQMTKREQDRREAETAKTRTATKKPTPKPISRPRSEESEDRPAKPARTAETSSRPPAPEVTQKKQSPPTVPAPSNNSRNRSNTFRGGAPGG